MQSCVTYLKIGLLGQLRGEVCGFSPLFDIKKRLCLPYIPSKLSEEIWIWYLDLVEIRWTGELIPDISTRLNYDLPFDYWLCQAISNYGCFRIYLFIRWKVGAELCPNCKLSETTYHVILNCLWFATARSSGIPDVFNAKHQLFMWLVIHQLWQEEEHTLLKQAITFSIDAWRG